MADTNSDQIAYWNDAGGALFVAFQDLLDRQLAPLGEAAMNVLAPVVGEHVLDVGCGCGATALALAARVGEGGEVLGVDVSGPMLEVAVERAALQGLTWLGFRQADAQSADLGEGVFDAVFSRFGVMFFAEPVVAFANLFRSLKVGGQLAFVCWQALEVNAWMRAPLEAAMPFLPPMDATDPFAPGPLAFADFARVRRILETAGFSKVEGSALETAIGGHGPEESLRLALGVGPLGKALREHPEARAGVTDAVQAVLERYARPDGVWMPAGVWIVRAEKGG